MSVFSLSFFLSFSLSLLVILRLRIRKEVVYQSSSLVRSFSADLIIYQAPAANVIGRDCLTKFCTDNIYV